MRVLTPCVGRDDVLDRLRLLLSSNRWVTLTGAPGCGKTLVARHTASSATAVVWVAGHHYATTESLVTACLDAIDAEVAPGDSPTMALKRALDGRDTLLVLDGVDALEGLGEILNDLVEDSEGWRLLCTATTVAGRAHEQVVRMPPLPLPSARQPLEGPALELLLARVAAAGGHSVDLAQHDALLRRLLSASGGLPSLIEQLAVQVALNAVYDIRILFLVHGRSDAETMARLFLLPAWLWAAAWMAVSAAMLAWTLRITRVPRLGRR